MKTQVSSILPLLKETHHHSRVIRLLSDEDKKLLLGRIAEKIEMNEELIVLENQKDLVRMEDDNPKKDRLLLNSTRIQALADSVREVAGLPDPTGMILSDKTLDNGLHVQKVSVPLGVVGIIYESRPNVTVDVASLCLRAGNAVVLRGGSDAFYTNTCLVKLIHEALSEFDIPNSCIQLLATDRALVHEMLTAEQYIDMIIPRGSQQLIDFVRQHATVPTIETGAGVCHTFVSEHADLNKAAEIVVNAKVSRPSVCNSLDTMVVSEKVIEEFLPLIVKNLEAYKVEIFADERAFAILKKQEYPFLKRAEEADFGREFLSFKCSIKTVENFEEAIQHISTYSSKHSEAILSEDQGECERFIQTIDAASVMSNASTRFTDGGVFGLGAEIGISTQKLHARGPFALEKLVTEKWIVRGNGQVR